MFIVSDARPGVTGASCDPPKPFPRLANTDGRLTGLRAEWRRLARRLADPDVELETDTVSVLVMTFDRLRAAGGVVDAMAAALVTQLRLQLADAEATVDG